MILPVAGVGRVRRGQTARRAAGVVLAVALAIGLAGCGTVPAQPTSSRSPHPFTPGPATPSPSAGTGTTAPVTVEPSGPASSATPGPTSAPTPSPRSRPSAPASSSPDVWVGTFRGHRVEVPRGHGATMSFTFDDGPWPGSTSQVLALLEQHHVHAVFCVVGNQAQAYPSLVRKEVAAGHELCDHSRDHDLSMGRKSQAYVDAEVGDGLRQIRRAAPAGTKVRFYRQPGGTWDAKVVRAMDAHDLDPLRWSDDPRDWSRPGSVAIVRRVVSSLHPGVVVLMHDGGGDRSQSVEALRFLLDAVVAAGWKPVLAPHVELSAKAAAEPR